MSVKRLTLRKFRDTYGPRTKDTTILLPGTVTNVAPGAAADGNALVTVNVNGAVFPCSYIGSAPAVNAIVRVAVCNSVPTILGVVHGAPPTS